MKAVSGTLLDDASAARRHCADVFVMVTTFGSNCRSAKYPECMSGDTNSVMRMRAVFVSGISAALSIAAHAFAGGAFPDQDALVLLLGLAVASGVLAAETGLAVPAVLVLSQAAGHLLLGHHDGHLHAPALGMITAHAAAVLVAAVLVQAAEKGCETALAVLRRIIPALYRVLPVTVAEPARPAHRPRIGPGIRLVAGTGSRAPPMVLR